MTTTRGNGPVLVTGASTGIGLAITRRLAADGIPVLACVRKPGDAERVGQIPNVEAVILDVTSAEDIERVRSRLDGQPLAGLVNNAGVSAGGPLEELSSQDWRDHFDVNLFGHVDVTRAMLDSVRRGDGRIVFIGSIGGRVGQPFLGPYSASKGAIRLLAASLRRELRMFGIWVALVEPGAMATEIWRKGGDVAEDVTAKLSPRGHELYGGKLEALQQVAVKENDHAEPPDHVAQAVEHALCARRPRPTYLVGRDARAANALQTILPARAMDLFVARYIGI
jgi:NAD(P)-dependent dehydrogenase (short-subunit alcohol dehydrogenase family)